MVLDLFGLICDCLKPEGRKLGSLPEEMSKGEQREGIDNQTIRGRQHQGFKAETWDQLALGTDLLLMSLPKQRGQGEAGGK